MRLVERRNLTRDLPTKRATRLDSRFKDPIRLGKISTYDRSRNRVRWQSLLLTCASQRHHHRLLSFPTDLLSFINNLLAHPFTLHIRLFLLSAVIPKSLTITSLLSDPSLAQVIRCTSYASEPVAPRYASPLPIASLITRWSTSSSI
jgi:hypothetical protein